MFGSHSSISILQIPANNGFEKTHRLPDGAGGGGQTLKPRSDWLTEDGKRAGDFAHLLNISELVDIVRLSA